MTVKFNSGRPAYICEMCRTLLAYVKDLDKPYGYPVYCTECAEKKLEEMGEEIHG